MANMEKNQKTNKRKILIISLIVVLIVSLIPVIIISVINNKPNVVKYNGLELMNTRDYYVVSGIDVFSENIVIPSEYDGKEIKEIGQKAFSNSKITSITIPKNIVSMGRDAFNGCELLKKVNYLGTIDEWAQIYFYNEHANPLSYSKALHIGGELVNKVNIETAMKISNYAFYNCENLTEVNVYEKIDYIGLGAFKYCNKIEKITIPFNRAKDRVYFWENSVFGYIFGYDTCEIEDDDKLEKHQNLYQGTQVQDDVNYLYYIPNSLRTVIITSQSIPNNAFYGCKNLTSVILSENVKFIGKNAFYGCESIDNVFIPKKVMSLYSSSFAGCKSLTNIEVDADNYYYKSVDGNLYTKYGGVLLQYAIGKEDTTFAISDRTSQISAYAFAYCDNLVSVNFGERVISVGDYAFYKCHGLKNISLNDCLMEIGSYAFYGCNNLDDFSLNEGLSIIGSYAFYGCRSLNDLMISSHVVNIGEKAFGNCSRLTLYCEKASRPYGWSNSWTFNRPVVWGYGYHKLDGVVYGVKDGKATVIKQSRDITTANIQPSINYKGQTYNVTSIGDNAFENCGVLKSITIPTSITSIGSNSFEYCVSLTSIVLPSSITSIGHKSFEYCVSLTIYCEAQSKPSGWYSTWNSYECPVVWGYTGN